LTVESSSSAASRSSRSDSTEHQLSILGDDKGLLLSVECRCSDDSSLPSASSDLSDVRQVDSSQDVCVDEGLLSSVYSMEVDRSESCTSEAVPVDVDSSDLHSDQLTDSDGCEELSSVANGAVDADETDVDSQQMSDVTEQSAVMHHFNVDATRDAPVSLSNNKQSIFSHADVSKPDHSVISSALKSISQNEDHGLAYIVFSKPTSDCVNYYDCL